MSEELRFPSTEWFERLAAFMRADMAMFRRLGSIECTMIVKVDMVDECMLRPECFR